MTTKVTTPWMKGLIISLIMIVLGIILYVTGQWQNQSLGYLQYVILIGGIIVADINFAKQMQGNVTFGNVFAHGFKATAAIIVIMVIYSVIFVKFIAPEMVDMIMDRSREEMEKKGNMSSEQISQATDMVKRFFIPFMIGGIVLGFGICGVISSLIGAAVAKKNRDYNPVQQ